MSYQGEIHVHPDHIRVEVSGRRTSGRMVTDAHVIGRRIVQECRKTGIENVLLISHLTGRLPALDAYELVAGLEDLGWSRSFKLASVDLNADSHEDNLFTETVAVNRAFQMKVFADERDAKEWLLSA